MKEEDRVRNPSRNLLIYLPGGRRKETLVPPETSVRISQLPTQTLVSRNHRAPHRCLTRKLRARQRGRGAGGLHSQKKHDLFAVTTRSPGVSLPRSVCPSLHPFWLSHKLTRPTRRARGSCPGIQPVAIWNALNADFYLPWIMPAFLGRKGIAGVRLPTGNVLRSCPGMQRPALAAQDPQLRAPGPPQRCLKHRTPFPSLTPPSLLPLRKTVGLAHASNSRSYCVTLGEPPNLSD